jgi:hypothetical protein
MPTIFIFLGFRFSFFSNDHLPIHIHVSKSGATATFDVLPDIVLVQNDGFKKSELKIIEGIIEENKEIIIERWNEFFKK